MALVTLAAAGLLVAAPTTSAPPAMEEINTAGTQRPGLQTIVLDPGHGGQAAGATGRVGFTEKDLTLDIAVRLREIIVRRLGLQVVLTRDADVDVPLAQRPEKANYWDADLFLSIHANAYRLDSVRGPETYFLSDTASDAHAGSVARAENADGDRSDVPAPDPTLEFILWDLAQTEYLRESSLLAEIIQTDLSNLWGTPDRGVKQAPFLVLKGATMPAVLVEVGYLSNPEDAGRLSDSAFRQQIAETLYRSITAFRAQHAELVGAALDP